MVSGGGGGSGDVLAKVTAGNAVCVRRSKVACRVAVPSLFLLRSLAQPLLPALYVFLPLSVSVPLSTACWLSRSLHRAAAAQTAGMHQMHRTDRCPSRSTASTCLLRPCTSPLPARSSARSSFFLYRFLVLGQRRASATYPLPLHIPPIPPPRGTPHPFYPDVPRRRSFPSSWILPSGFPFVTPPSRGERSPLGTGVFGLAVSLRPGMRAYAFLCIRKGLRYAQPCRQGDQNLPFLCDLFRSSSFQRNCSPLASSLLIAPLCRVDARASLSRRGRIC